MSRLNRLLTQLNSSGSQTFFNHHHSSHRISIPNPTFRFLPSLPKIISRIPPSKFHKFTTSAIPAGHHEPDPHAPAMDSSTPPFQPESDESPVENFVHIDNNRSESDPDANLEDTSTGEGVEFKDLDQRKVLPEELSRNVMVLSCESTVDGGSCDVFLVGTAHVSQESCEEVQAVINFLKPQVVFLELCSSRVAVLTPQNLKVPTMSEMVDMWKKKQNAFGILYSWFLAKVATKLEVFPGSEFRVAFEEAKKYGGKVILGDRPVQITLRRTWEKMPLWHKTKLIYNLLFQALFLPSSEDLNRMLKEMDDSDMLTLVIQEMSKEFPTLMETLVHERDQYMSSTLLRVASEHSSVVAVVGKGHLRGIKKHWQQPVEMKDLMQMPLQKPAVSVVKLIASLGVAAAGVAIISGIYLSSKK